MTILGGGAPEALTPSRNPHLVFLLQKLRETSEAKLVVHIRSHKSSSHHKQTKNT